MMERVDSQISISNPNSAAETSSRSRRNGTQRASRPRRTQSASRLATGSTGKNDSTRRRKTKKNSETTASHLSLPSNPPRSSSVPGRESIVGPPDQQCEISVKPRELHHNFHISTPSEEASRPEFFIEGLYPNHEVLYAPPLKLPRYPASISERPANTIGRRKHDNEEGAHIRLPSIKEDASRVQYDHEHRPYDDERDHDSHSQKFQEPRNRQYLEDLRKDKKDTVAAFDNDRGLVETGVAPVAIVGAGAEAKLEYVSESDAERLAEDDVDCTKVAAHTRVYKTPDSIGDPWRYRKYQMFSGFDIFL